jgi:hypothetical protein
MKNSYSYHILASTNRISLVPALVPENDVWINHRRPLRVSVFLYLANILVLHITAPALFAFETFNSTRPVRVATRSPPSFDSQFSQVNWSDHPDSYNAM